jgi:hypothetical protein
VTIADHRQNLAPAIGLKGFFKGLFKGANRARELPLHEQSSARLNLRVTGHPLCFA